MNDSKLTASEPKDSELQTILFKFNDELSKLDEFSNIILDKTCKISNCREPSAEDKEKTDQREGYVGEFDSAISRLRAYNNRLEEIVGGLNRIVG